jgi:hypothetical protein
MSLFKQEPQTQEEIMLADLEAKIIELDPSVKYVLWFKRSLSHKLLLALHDTFKKYEIKCVIITGIEAPEIYKFEEDVNNKEQTSNSSTVSKVE